MRSKRRAYINSNPIIFLFVLVDEFEVVSAYCCCYSHRAAQKLNLSSKKKKHRPSASSVPESPLFSTCFSSILQTSPPPAPPCLLRAVSKVKDTPGLGKVGLANTLKYWFSLGEDFTLVQNIKGIGKTCPFSVGFAVSGPWARVRRLNNLS